VRRLALAIAGCLLALRPAGAHPLDPSLLEVREVRGEPVEVLWRQPSLQPRDAPVRSVLPRRCVQIGHAEVRQGDPWSEARWRLDCGGRSLVGERIGVEGLERGQTDALLEALVGQDALAPLQNRPATHCVTFWRFPTLILVNSPKGTLVAAVLQ
jgi:hypothetical protein